MNTPDQMKNYLNDRREQGFGKRGKGASQLARYLALIDRADAMNDTLIKKIAEIERRSILSRQGKDDAKRDVATEFIKESGWLQRDSTETAEKRNWLLAQVLDYKIPDKTVDPLLAYFRQKEIRDSLRTHPQSDQVVTFLRAAERLDAETMRALLTGPGEPWITEDAQQRGEEAYGQRKDPERWGLIRDLALLADQIDGIKNFFAHCLLSLGASKDAVLAGLGISEEGPAHS